VLVGEDITTLEKEEWLCGMFPRLSVIFKGAVLHNLVLDLIKMARDVSTGSASSSGKGIDSSSSSWRESGETVQIDTASSASMSKTRLVDDKGTASSTDTTIWGMAPQPPSTTAIAVAAFRDLLTKYGVDSQALGRGKICVV
jgi:hypothetical protein